MSPLTFTMASATLSSILYPPNTTLSYVATPVVSLPGVLSPITDPTWGTKITRISGTANALPEYSKKQCWNSDGTLLALSRNYPGVLLNGNTYAVIDASFQGNGDALWSRTNPRILYGVNQNAGVFRSLDPLVPGSYTTLHTFAGYSTIDCGAQGNLSDDGRYVALRGLKTSDSTYTIFVYDIIGDSIYASRTGITINPHAVTMSSSGNYVILTFPGDGTGTEQGTWLLNKDLSSNRQLFASTSHADVGYDFAGNEVWVTDLGSTDDGTKSIWSIRLDNDARVKQLPNNSALWWGHTSLRNDLRPGWAYLSNYDTVTPGAIAGRDQLIAVKLDGSMTVEVYGHAHHGSISTTVYGTPSRDGRRVLFGSEWDATSIYAYIAEAQ